MFKLYKRCKFRDPNYLEQLPKVQNIILFVFFFLCFFYYREKSVYMIILLSVSVFMSLIHLKLWLVINKLWFYPYSNVVFIFRTHTKIVSNTTSLWIYEPFASFFRKSISLKLVLIKILYIGISELIYAYQVTSKHSEN